MRKKTILFIILFIAAGMTREVAPILSEILVFTVIVWIACFLFGTTLIFAVIVVLLLLFFLFINKP